MMKRMTTSCFIVLALISLGRLPASSARGATGQERPLPDDIPGLIETLSSPNKPPKAGTGSHAPRYPRGFDHAAQERVLAAEQKLAEKGLAAFPELVKHLSDARYSETVAYAAWVNLSVGNVCEQIIERQILPRNSGGYKSRDGADGKSHMPPDYFSAHGGVKKWWATHSQMTLQDMKIEALKWTIKEEEKVGFASPEDRQEYLEPLQAELRTLRPK